MDRASSQRAEKMTGVRKADRSARRQVLLIAVLAALAGILLLAGLGRFHEILREWLLSDPREIARRVRLIYLLFAVVMSAPPLALAVYLWSLGAKVSRAREYPPPGHRVVRDTPIIDGSAAISRGRVLKLLALCLAVACACLWLLFWRFV